MRYNRYVAKVLSARTGQRAIFTSKLTSSTAHRRWDLQKLEKSEVWPLAFVFPKTETPRPQKKPFADAKMSVGVVVKFVVKEGSKDTFLEAANKMITETRKEKGIYGATNFPQPTESL